MEEADLLFVTQNGQSTSVSNASLLRTQAHVTYTGVSDPMENISDGLQIGSFCLLVNIRESEFLSGITHEWNPHSECFFSPAPDSVQGSSRCHCLELHFFFFF